jgi:crotonobetainyl-CoA:carnitine CoA-transferase CaiB-like acyl-CoA transferase
MGKYWAEACEVVGRPELATDERFADAATIGANAAIGTELLAEAFAERTADEWRERLQTFSGQWAMVQDCLEAAADPQAVANGYVQDYEDVDGQPYKLASPPVQFGGEPAAALRAPAFNEHGDAILESLGLDWDRIMDLKVRAVVA